MSRLTRPVPAHESFRARAVRRTLMVVGAAATFTARATAVTAQQSAAPAASPASYLDVLRARTDLRQASAELARASALRERSMLSPSEYDERRAAWERTRFAYLGALATAGGARARVSIARAVKARRADGRLRVELTLRNDSRVPSAADAFSMSPGPRDDTTARDVDDTAPLVEWTTARGVAVSLKTEPGPGGVTISQPYERTLVDLAPGRETTVSFDLLEDLADVVVALDGAGRTDERRVRLEVGSEQRGIAVDAAQSALEGDLGTQVLYDLRLRRARPSAGAIQLDVQELPPEVAYEFREAVGGKRLRQLRLADGATDGRVQLALTLPDRPSSALPVDRALTFAVVADDATGAAAGKPPASPATLQLELTPRGIARLEMRPATLTLATALDRPSTLPVTIRNAGSGRVEDVRLRVEPPPRWHVTSTPSVVARLAPGEEARVELTVQPASDATVGDYELRVGIDDAGSARRIDVEDKLVRLRLVGRGGWLVPTLLALAAAALTVVGFTHGRRWVNR